MGRSQKATCESKALESLFPPHWVHKLDIVQFLGPLQGDFILMGGSHQGGQQKLGLLYKTGRERRRRETGNPNWL